jgi:hypothetical protein
MKRRFAIALIIVLSGCAAPSARLTFPYRKLTPTTQPQWFDVDGDKKPDFAVTFDASGQMDALEYDDNEDGSPDRVYHLADYANDRVPHLVILLDSVPYQCVAERYAAGEFRWCDPPSKIIAPFPSLTEVCYTELLHAPPLPGAIDQYYSRRNQKVHNGLWDRAIGGEQYPWERYLHYRSKFSEEGLAYLDPRPWYQAELERARHEMEVSPDRVTVVYLTSASGMACKYGRPGIDQVLDGAARLCLQLLYERHGALKISVMADHGHNLMASKNIDVEKLLKPAGFNITKRLKKPNDVVLEVNGLVTYAAVRTTKPAAVADQLLTNAGVEFAMYMEGERVILRDAYGASAIDGRTGYIRYQPLTRDVLGYAAIIDAMKSSGKLDADGFAARSAWFAATADAEYPDGPTRAWEAFHERVVDPPEVMFTTHDGYCAGMPSFERFIKIESTHGSLNQINSATFLLTMTHRPEYPTTMPTRDVMKTIEPTWRPGVIAK